MKGIFPLSDGEIVCVRLSKLRCLMGDGVSADAVMLMTIHPNTVLPTVRRQCSQHSWQCGLTLINFKVDYS